MSTKDLGTFLALAKLVVVLQESVAQHKTNKRNTNKWGGGIREWDFLGLTLHENTWTMNEWGWFSLLWQTQHAEQRNKVQNTATPKPAFYSKMLLPRALGSLLFLLDKEWFPKANKVWKQEARRRFNWENYCLHHNKSTTVSSLFSSPLFFFKAHDTASDRDLVPAGSNISSRISSLQNNAHAFCICPIICIS